MDKPPKVLTWILVLGVLVVGSVPALITLFFFQAYLSVGVGLTLLLLGGLQCYAGIKLRQAAKRRGESIPSWWKHYLIVLGLAVACFGLLDSFAWADLNIKLIHDVLGSSIGPFVGILLVVFTLGLGIYGMFLMLQQIATNKRSTGV
jgi:hypothetical protein